MPLKNSTPINPAAMRIDYSPLVRAQQAKSAGMMQLSGAVKAGIEKAQDKRKKSLEDAQSLKIVKAMVGSDTDLQERLKASGIDINELDKNVNTQELLGLVAQLQKAKEAEKIASSEISYKNAMAKKAIAEARGRRLENKALKNPVGEPEEFEPSKPMLNPATQKVEMGQVSKRTGKIRWQNAGAPPNKGSLVTFEKGALGGEAQTEEQKEMGRNRAEGYKKNMDAGQFAMAEMSNLDEFERLLDSAGEGGTGSMAKYTVGIRRFAKDLGMDIDENKLADQEGINSIANVMAMKLRSPESGGGLPGSVSEKDLQFLKDATVGIDKSLAGNKRIVNIARRMNQRKMDVARLQSEYYFKNKTSEGFEKHLMDWAEDHPLFDDLGNVDNTPTPIPPEAEIVTVNNQSDFDKLPSGAVFIENGVKYRKP